MSPFRRKPDAATLEKKGDQARSKKKFRDAVTHYSQALELKANDLALHDKIITTYSEFESEWSQEDFVDSLSWTMSKQELENPALKRAHARVTPEYKQASLLVKKIFESENEEAENKAIEQLRNWGDLAFDPLVDFLTSFKSALRKRSPTKP